MSGRFYKMATASHEPARWSVLLDGRPLRTPGKAVFTVPTRALAIACAREWAMQDKTIRPETMPLTRLCNVAIDRTPQARAEMVAGVAKYGETDLLCHRADAPAALAEAQARTWDAWLGWSVRELSFAPACVVGVQAASNDTAPLASAAEALDDFALTGLAHGAALSGSAILGFALARGALSGAGAFAAAALDELFQLEKWGEDEEARARLTHIEHEFSNLAAFFAALKETDA